MASITDLLQWRRANGKVHVPPLEPGDHLDQPTFHQRYEAMPDNIKAELIGGVVYMPSPRKIRHGRQSPILATWLVSYQAATPGTDVLENATTILGPESEPQPDACLLITSECGGQTRIDYDEEGDGYIVGSPEFIAELASSSESYDLHGKKADYERAGVKEYLVVTLRERQVHWFILRGGRFEPLAPSVDGILRSESFPGLWLDPAALLERDTARVLEVLHQGLTSAEHTAWVRRLAGK
jgi:Uma2 family endonuclease